MLARKERAGALMSVKQAARARRFAGCCSRFAECCSKDEYSEGGPRGRRRARPAPPTSAGNVLGLLGIRLRTGAAIRDRGERGLWLYRNGSIYSAAGAAQAGIRNRFAAGVVLGDDFSKYVSAEFRYLYHDGHPFLQPPGVKGDMQGNSNALTWGLLFHFKDREHRMRP